MTPKPIGSYWKLFMIDAGRFSAQTAYAAVNTLRIDDMRPHIYRTHDAGKTWTEIVGGMEGAGAVNAVREDPKKRGLLYASTENGVYVSFDDGDRWQSLRLNLPASSVRDLIVKDDDVAVGTHGRGFWILDDIARLRQIDGKTAARDAVLFKPAAAWRVRWNTSTDMPWPKDEPTMPNPPEGTAIDYYLKSAQTGPITLEIVTPAGRLVRRYSSADFGAAGADCRDVTRAALLVPPTAAAFVGRRRASVSLGSPLPAARRRRCRSRRFVDSGDPCNTAPSTGTPLVTPGIYTVKLTVNGASQSQTMTVKQDPRVKTSALVLQNVYSLINAVYFGAVDARVALERAQSLRDQIAARLPPATAEVKTTLEAFDKKLDGIAGAITGAGGRGGGGPAGRGGGAPSASTETLASVAASLGGLVNALGSADVQPTANQLSAISTARAVAARVMTRWRAIDKVELAALNAALKSAGVDPIK